MKGIEKYILVALLVGLMALGACSSNVWDDLPSPIAKFIEQYYPGSTVENYHELDEGYYVKIKNGATLKFDSELAWTSVDGNGVTLPQVMVYDQLPPALYTYLQGNEEQSGVYSMTRDARFYKLTMSDTVITYDVTTEKVTVNG